jgi:hypothetical protein
VAAVGAWEGPVEQRHRAHHLGLDHLLPHTSEKGRPSSAYPADRLNKEARINATPWPYRLNRAVWAYLAGERLGVLPGVDRDGAGPSHVTYDERRADAAAAVHADPPVLRQAHALERRSHRLHLFLYHREEINGQNGEGQRSHEGLEGD